MSSTMARPSGRESRHNNRGVVTFESDMFSTQALLPVTIRSTWNTTIDADALTFVWVVSDITATYRYRVAESEEKMSDSELSKISDSDSLT